MKRTNFKRLKPFIILVSVVGLLLISFFVFKHWSVDQKQVREFLNRDAVILDVRTKTEFDRGHIKNAVNISLGKLRTERLNFSKNTAIITCCSHGLRSVKAVGILKSRGYQDVVNGGAWIDLEACMESAGK